MRILMLNPFYPPYLGGTEKHVYEVSKRLAKKHDVTVLTAQLKGTPKREEAEGVTIVRSKAWVLEDLPGPLPPPIPVMPDHAKDLRRLLRSHDILHAHNRFFYGLDLVSASKKAEKPLFLTLHNARTKGIGFATDFWGQAYDDTIGKEIMGSCTGVLGVSQNTLDTTLPKKFSGQKGVAYNGVDSKTFRPHATNVKEMLGCDRMVLCVARFVPQKGLKYLVEAMRHVDADLVLVGRGPLEKTLKKQAKKPGIRARFVTDTISEETLSDCYAACDAFALPSLWEPFGMVAVEAMASGKPVVATRIGGLPEVVDEKEGLLVPPKNAKALAEKINFLLSNPRIAKKMGKAGRKKAAQKFTWGNTAKAYEKIYKEAGF